MKIKFDEVNHKYYLGKKELTSVTTLLKRHGLSTDFSEVMISPSVLADARDRGNKIHEDWKNYIQQCIVPKTNEGLEILDWHKSIGVVSNGRSEYIVHNEEFAGTVDYSFLEIKSEEVIAYLTDIKSGSQKDIKSWSWQLSLYEFLEKKTYDKLLVLHCPKNKNLEPIEVPRIPKEEIEKLLECERNCEIYQPKTVELATVSTEISTKISQTIQTIERLEEVVKLFREAVLSEMQLKGIKKFDNGEISITYIEPTTRVSIDSKKLKEELPDVYKKYSKVSDVKASVKIIKKESK